MKKCLLLLPFLLFLFACSEDKTDMPRLEFTSIFLNGADEDFSKNLEDIPPLSPGDYIDVSLLLDGNGTDLKTFVMKCDNENIESALTFSEDEVSNDFTSLPEESLRFKDEVQRTVISVKLTVLGAREEEVNVCFNLNTKHKGVVCYLDLRTTTEPRASEEE